MQTIVQGLFITYPTYTIADIFSWFLQTLECARDTVNWLITWENNRYFLL